MKRKERLFLSLSLVAGMALSACGGAAQEAKDSASQAQTETKAEEAGKTKKDDKEEIDYFKNRTRFWHRSYREETEKNSVIKKFNTFLSFVIVLEALSIAMLIWK